MTAAGERVDRGDVGVLFVDLLFALVVVELLEPLRRPEEITAEGWIQLVLVFFLTLLSWIGYHLSVSRLDEPVRVDSPAFLHLLLDVLMVASYWLAAISFERAGEEYSWWVVPNPSAVPEAAFVLAAFGLYVAWDWTARWIHGPWAERVNARRESARTPFVEDHEVWDIEAVRRWRNRSRPTLICCGAALAMLVIAVLAQERGPNGVSDRAWVVGIDVSLFAVVVGFRFLKEFASYPAPLNRMATVACGIAFILGLAVPLLS